MSISNEQLKHTLSKIRADFSSYEATDQQMLIRVGAALEELASELPEEATMLIEATHLSLQGLQALYLQQAADISQLTQALQATLIASEQVLAAPSNPLSQTMLARAQETLSKAIAPLEKSSAAAPENLTAEISETTTPPPDVQSTVLAEEFSGDPSLDDIAALLIELDHTNVTGLARIHNLLLKVSKDISVTQAAQEHIAPAIQLAAVLAQGNCPNAEQQFAALGQLIEKAQNAAFAPAQPIKPATAVANTQPEIVAMELPANNEAVVSEAVVNEAHMALPTATSDSELPPDADVQLLSEFIVESNEYIQGAEAALLALETDSDSVESVNIIFRAFHTIKGTSAFLGLKDVTELAHLAESFLSRIRDREIRCVGGYADLALRSIDSLKELLENVQKAFSSGKIVRPAHFHELIHILANPEASGVSEQTKVSPLHDTVSEATPADLIATTNELNQKIAAMNGGPKPTRTSAGEITPEASVRVRTDRLDKLMDIIGELVIAHSMTAQDENITRGNNHELTRKVTHVGKIVRELQDMSTAMRMVPLKATFQKMARLVRDVAQKSGKQIEFVYEGEDTEIDRHMVDIINDPLIHMLRNAVDHGIESREVRLANGKSHIGHIRLTAYNAGGNVVVELQDDGQGLNRDRILEKAVAKGLVESEKGFSDSEIYNLIFAPGFSTNDQVTDLSGRGVGMDVVKRNVESLRGFIGITSEAGKGCTFSIQLPLTLAITDGMLIRIGSESYIIPTANIHLSFRPTAESVSTVTGRGEMVMLRGELLPIFRLHRLLEVPNAEQDPTKALLVIVADGRRRCALLVDELLGQQQLVVKSLGNGIGKTQGISGGAILGDGRVGLILDCAEIVALVRQNTSAVDRKIHVTQAAA